MAGMIAMWDFQNPLVQGWAGCVEPRSNETEWSGVARLFDPLMLLHQERVSDPGVRPCLLL